MLYHLHEMSRAALMPMRLFTDTQAMLLKGSHIPGGHRIASAYSVFEDLTRRYPKPAFNLDTTVCDGEEVPVRETIVERKPFAQLKHFVRETERPDDPRLLIIAPLSGHYATLLRGTVAALLPEHDVYITDWRDARMVPIMLGPFGLDDYIDYLIDFLTYLGSDTHVLAVCQPAVPALAATALMAEDGHGATPRSLALMNGPVDARINPTAPNNLATDHDIAWFRRHTIHTVPAPYPGVMRSVYPGFLQLAGFMSMNLDRHMDAYWALYQSLIDDDAERVGRHRRFYDDYLAVMDLPAAFYLETIERVFQKFQLARGCLTHRGRQVDLSAIRDTALFTIEGEKDDICSPGQTEAAHHLCPNIPDARRRHRCQPGVGHYGVFNGRHWRNEIAPQLRDFIRAS
jgi:poly(3-hydroxybutyrate) depolymerase